MVLDVSCLSVCLCGTAGERVYVAYNYPSNNRTATFLPQEIDALRLLKITPLTLVTYLTLLEHHYRSDNTYHNSIHAADVTQSANVLLGASALQVITSYLYLFTSGSDKRGIEE